MVAPTLTNHYVCGLVDHFFDEPCLECVELLISILLDLCRGRHRRQRIDNYKRSFLTSKNGLGQVYRHFSGLGGDDMQPLKINPELRRPYRLKRTLCVNDDAFVIGHRLLRPLYDQGSKHTLSAVLTPCEHRCPVMGYPPEQREVQDEDARRYAEGLVNVPRRPDYHGAEARG